MVQIVDIRHKPSADDMHMINFLVENGFPFIIVLTKKDKLKKSQFIKRMEELKTELGEYEGISLFPFSALNGEGAEEIRNVIDECVDDFYSTERTEEFDEE